MNVELIVKHIDWEMGRYGICYGSIAKISKLFTIDTGSEKYTLHHQIPRFKQGITSDSLDEAKKKAEKILYAFLSEILILREKT